MLQFSLFLLENKATKNAYIGQPFSLFPCQVVISPVIMLSNKTKIRAN
jgi:hypothetical protein